MGKGDKRTFRGKLTLGSYGNSRPKSIGAPTPVKSATPSVKASTAKTASSSPKKAKPAPKKKAE